MKQVDVALADGRDYSICIGVDLPADPAATAALHSVVAGRRCLLISDTNVAPLYAQRTLAMARAAGAAELQQCVFTAGEASKTWQTAGELLEQAVGFGLDRRSVILALGGGVVGDLAGFVAATYMRGIEFVQLPTSLLAMVDSSVGGKTGVDLPQGKNLVGAFHQPRLVLADLSTLHSLPPRQLKCGLAEVAKYAMILNVEFYHFLRKNAAALLEVNLQVYVQVVEACCRYKAEIVVADERETGRRAILNYGHTFGHALEVSGGYAGLNHGEAVAVGMGMAADLAVMLALAPASLPQQQDKLLASLKLPTRLPAALATSIQQLYAYMHHDKKSQNGRIRVVLPRAIGEVMVVDAPESAQVEAAIRGRCD